MANLMVVKRDGRVVPFDNSRITRAVERCYAECESEPSVSVKDIVDEVGLTMGPRILSSYMGAPPISVEEIQDLVEEVLIHNNAVEAAKRYILYRAEHARIRGERPIPDDMKAAFEADNEFFPTPLQRFQYLDKYARYNPDLGRRETWVETVGRTVDFLRELAAPYANLKEMHWIVTFGLIREAILRMEVMPSMRLLAMAGDPARRDNLTLFNCSYLPVESLEAFSEALSISMAGCGVGFSVESKYVDQLPTVDKYLPVGRMYGPGVHTIEDSAEGWSRALLDGLQHWFYGTDVEFDYSQIRANGTPLKTKGGRASGPEPLRKMLEFCKARILARQGARLRPVDAHDMMCAVGNAAVSGGVRRTAMISLFDEDDREMLHAKDSGFERENSQRWNANNSMIWKSVATMDQAVFIERFMTMVRSGNGEPGIFVRDNAARTMPSRRSSDHEFGTNPCGEIFLRPYGLCNLSAAVVRAGDTYTTLAEKVRIAAIIGTIQSLATNYPSLRSIWRQNAEQERLLGVDITGQMDNPAVLEFGAMEELRHVAVRANEDCAERLGINPSAAVTCVKPSGNTSQLVDCASGLHARWAPYYIRNVRAAASSPVARVLLDAGVPHSPENNEDPGNPRTWVFSFPVKSPDGAITRLARSATDQCEWWLRNKLYWTEHNPSVTITYRPGEVIDLMKWVWDHREEIGGMSFFPSYDGNYDQLPYIEISKEEYERRVEEFPEIEWAKVFHHEQSDMSTASTTLACEGEVCLYGE